MQLIRGLEQLSNARQPSVVSIGNYDGVHLGHQRVIKTLLQQSDRLDVPATVITFEPLAKEFFQSHKLLRLSSLEERADRLFELGVDQVLCIKFTTEFADYSPEQFVRQVLLDGLGVEYVCVGDDFRFGKNRQGDFALLQHYGDHHGFQVQAHDTFELDGLRVSSGRIRNALLANDLALAERLLGRPFSMFGTVSQGQQLGRTINYPTANIVLDESALLAVNGVYAVSVVIEQKPNICSVLQGVANVGKRPTVDGKESRIEVHIFDFDGDLYGQTLQVMFHHKIRAEQKFESIDDLTKQIDLDAVAARRFFEKKS